eukprot:scaffold12513_cov103-Skeletonema_dohrnii-CCMP3373.AAC.11
MMTKALAVLVSTQLLLEAVTAFCPLSRPLRPSGRVRSTASNNDQLRRTQAGHIFATDDSNENNTGSSSSYESSASVTKGLVSSLTSLTNNIFGGSSKEPADTADLKTSLYTPPTSPEELLTRIQKEYTQNNYLWTGNIDTSSFVPNCTFTDPTLSFVGVEKYVQNVGNLVPIVEYALGEEQISNSTLLDITLEKDKGYIQTRWNMIGELNALFWKPKIDVIGRTKFWYRQGETNGNDSNSAVQVYFYDEEWEIPAGLALLQLVTPAGTIRRTDEERVMS